MIVMSKLPDSLFYYLKHPIRGTTISSDKEILYFICHYTMHFKEFLYSMHLNIFNNPSELLTLLYSSTHTNLRWYEVSISSK